MVLRQNGYYFQNNSNKKNTLNLVGVFPIIAIEIEATLQFRKGLLQKQAHVYFQKYFW